jgi:adenylate cyclase class 2
VPAAPRVFEDNLLLDDEVFTLRRSGRVLRLRRSGGAAVLTFKGPGQEVAGVKSRAEVETGVADADAIERLLAGIGLLPRFRYQKYRETYRLADVEIVIDETPIGTFLEIEGPAEGIHGAAAALGYARSDYVLLSYPALHAAAGGTGDMVFPDRA